MIQSAPPDSAQDTDNSESQGAYPSYPPAVYHKHAKLLREVALLTLPLDVALVSNKSLIFQLLISTQLFWIALLVATIGLMRWQLVALIESAYYLAANLPNRTKKWLGFAAFAVFILTAFIDLAVRLEDFGIISLVVLLIYLALLIASSYKDMRKQIDGILERKLHEMQLSELTPVLFGILAASLAAARALPLLSQSLMPGINHIFVAAMLTSLLFLLTIDPDSDFTVKPCLYCRKEGFVALEKNGACTGCRRNMLSHLSVGRLWRPLSQRFEKRP